MKTCPECGASDYKIMGDKHFMCYYCNNCRGMWDDSDEVDDYQVKIPKKRYEQED